MAEYISRYDQVVIIPLDEASTLCVCGRRVLWTLGVYEWRCKCGLRFVKATGMNEVYEVGGTTNGSALFL